MKISHQEFLFISILSFGIYDTTNLVNKLIKKVTSSVPNTELFSTLKKGGGGRLIVH